MIKVTPVDALATIQGLAGANRIQFSPHARQRMYQRQITEADVRRVLITATRCTAQEGGRWKTEGLDMSGDDVTCVVVIEAGVIVVTVY